MDAKEDGIRHEPTQRPDLGGQEVGRHEDIHVRADTLFPRRGGRALWGWREAMAFQDVAHSLVTDSVPEIGQSADDPVVAPRTILLRHAEHQRFEVFLDLRAPWRDRKSTRLNSSHLVIS